MMSSFFDRHPLAAIVLAAAGTSLFEMYDFQVYGYLASFVAGNFFSASVSSNLSLIEAFGTYSAAFLMRPLGGLYFGRIGDSEGRHSALVQSTALMAVPSLLMGILPTYDRIGATATWAVVACRMAQGFALGGQLTGSYVLMVEAAPPNRRGFYGSLVSAAASVGAALASGVVALVSGALSSSAMASWGWRLPFVVGGVLAPPAVAAALFFAPDQRRSGAYTKMGGGGGGGGGASYGNKVVAATVPASSPSGSWPAAATRASVLVRVQALREAKAGKGAAVGPGEGSAADDAQSKPPVVAVVEKEATFGGDAGSEPSGGGGSGPAAVVFGAERRRLLLMVGCVAGSSSAYYFKVWLLTYLSSLSQSVTYAQAAAVSTATSCLELAVYPACGLLADSLAEAKGRDPHLVRTDFMRGGQLFFLLFSPLLFWWLAYAEAGSAQAYRVAFAGQLAWALALGFSSGSLAAFEVEVWLTAGPAAARDVTYTAVSLGHSIAMVLFGGLVPTVATALYGAAWTPSAAPFLLVPAVCTLSLSCHAARLADRRLELGSASPGGARIMSESGSGSGGGDSERAPLLASA